MSLLAGDDGAPLNPYVPPDVPEERAGSSTGSRRPSRSSSSRRRSAIGSPRASRGARSAVRVESISRSTRASRATRIFRRAQRSSARSPRRSRLRARSSPSCARASSRSFIPAPILAVTLRATELARKESRALDLFDPEAERRDRRVAAPRRGSPAEISARIASGTLTLANTWIPEARTRLVPLGRASNRPPGSRSRRSRRSRRASWQCRSTRAASRRCASSRASRRSSGGATARPRRSRGVVYTRTARPRRSRGVVNTRPTRARTGSRRAISSRHGTRAARAWRGSRSIRVGHGARARLDELNTHRTGPMRIHPERSEGSPTRKRASAPGSFR